MNAVFSLSTISKNARPNLLFGNASLKITYLLFTLSVLQAKKFFKKVILETDDNGYELLVNTLKLPFDEVNLTLNSLDKDYSDFWMLGKIAAYKNQKEPFIHLDLDYVIYSEFKTSFLNNDVFSENPEAGNYFHMIYLKLINEINSKSSFKPKSFGLADHAVCMGIIGFNDINLCQGYCDELYEFIFSKENENFVKSLENKKNYCIIYEQYFLECFVKYNKKEIIYLSPSLDKKIAALDGKCHYMMHKKDIKYERVFSLIVYSLYPDRYTEICKILNENSEVFLKKLTLDEIIDLY